MADEQASPAAAGPLGEDARAVAGAAREAAAAYAAGFHTLRRLFAAEVALAREALVHALVWLLLAMVMLGTAYALLTALLVAGLNALGLPMPLAIALPLALSVAGALLAGRRARALMRLADFEGTRRQLAAGLPGLAGSSAEAGAADPPAAGAPADATAGRAP